ncbi:MAG: hypothetical protein EOP36_02185 [Rubrivivax sp.]|nr:MAG: hypothetical protein EOP36_02185 [Rubrivivax sp.]
MSTLTRTLTISAITAALAGSFGFAQAQSASNGNGSTGNPDPNATLGISSPTDNSNRNVDSMRTRANRNTPGAFYGEAGDSNLSQDSLQAEPGSVEYSHDASEPPTRGESAKSNNSYGNSRTPLQGEER